MLRLGYGTFRHAPGECEYTHSAQTERTEGQTPKWIRHRFDIRGCIIASGTAAIAARVTALKAAYSRDGQDFKILDDANNALPGSLLSGNCIGGVRVVSPPSFPDNRNAAYVTFLNYQLTLEGDEAITSGTAANTYSAFQETVESEGGGPRFGYIEQNRGRPIRQLLREASVYKYTQAGRAVGLFSRPSPPAPLWPEYLIEAPRIREVTPFRIGSGAALDYRDFEVNWTYRFEADVPLRGGPHVWK